MPLDTVLQVGMVALACVPVLLVVAVHGRIIVKVVSLRLVSTVVVLRAEWCRRLVADCVRLPLLPLLPLAQNCS